MTLSLREIRDLAYRFVPGKAADERLYERGARSWWPAHEIGHFLVATATECDREMFGVDLGAKFLSPAYRYVVARENAAISISQRILRRSGHGALADSEIRLTNEDTLEFSFEPWCKRAVSKLLRANRAHRIPTSFSGLERMLARKAKDVGTTTFASASVAIGFGKLIKFHQNQMQLQNLLITGG